MIHVFVGTKAQFIKMAPIMQELDRQGIVYNFINGGQHADLLDGLIRDFGLRKPDVYLRPEGTNIDTIHQALGWTTKSLAQLAFRRAQSCQNVFGAQSGVCLIHGDTLTTVISLAYAKRCGLQVAHIEAGLRSYHVFNPFPEEIIRLIAMRWSDVLFAPSAWALENLRKMGYSNKAISAGGNTGIEAVRYALTVADRRIRPCEPYAVVTIHRVETIYSRARLTLVTELVERIAREWSVVFVLHEPTRQQLRRFGLYDRIKERASAKMLPLQPYPVFVDLLAGAQFVVTDGGSIQEETYFLNVPCLIMRSNTERKEGLGKNAFLAGFDQEQIEWFLEKHPSLRRQALDDDVHPSSVIVNHLLAWA